MASLNEIKGRIASVKSTLKITSAMKMVASSKLRKAQNAVAGMLPYSTALGGILEDLMTPANVDEAYFRPLPTEEPAKVALVCLSSNSSLCGAFNSNVLKKTLAAAGEYKALGYGVTIVPIGKKISDSAAKVGYGPFRDYSALCARPSYEEAASLADSLVAGFLAGGIDKIEFIYNHYKSASSQETVREVFLPMTSVEESGRQERDLIVEPSSREQVALLLPKVLRLRLFTVLLDSAASEHAARTLAMQIATDNANELLQELNLEYNKGRQQKITSEILDLEGGAAQ